MCVSTAVIIVSTMSAILILPSILLLPSILGPRILLPGGRRFPPNARFFWLPFIFFTWRWWAFRPLGRLFFRLPCVGIFFILFVVFSANFPRDVSDVSTIEKSPARCRHFCLFSRSRFFLAYSAVNFPLPSVDAPFICRVGSAEIVAIHSWRPWRVKEWSLFSAP